MPWFDRGDGKMIVHVLEHYEDTIRRLRSEGWREVVPPPAPPATPPATPAATEPLPTDPAASAASSETPAAETAAGATPPATNGKTK